MKSLSLTNQYQTIFLLQKLATSLVTNQLGAISAAPGQTVLEQALSSLIAHSFIALSSAPDHHLLRPLINILAQPAQMQVRLRHIKGTRN